MKAVLIVLGIMLMIFLLGSGIIILAIAWTHYPQGVIKAWIEKGKTK